MKIYINLNFYNVDFMECLRCVGLGEWFFVCKDLKGF